MDIKGLRVPEAEFHRYLICVLLHVGLRTETDRHEKCVFTLSQRTHGGLLGPVFMIPTSKVNAKGRRPQVEH